MRHKKTIIIVLILILFSLFVVKPIVTYNQSGISGEKWMDQQHTFLSELSDFTDTLDSVVSLYLINSISYEDFQTHMTSLNEAFIILKAEYENLYSSVHIKEGSYTAEQKRSAENIENCYAIIEEILLDCNDPEIAMDKEVLSYRYLAAQQAITNEIIDYHDN